MKAVHFGPGNIGRGFVGLLLSQSNYEVVFISRDETKTSLLQTRNEYQVNLADDNNGLITVRNVTAVNIGERAQVAQEISEATIITTAVGATNLKHIAKSIAEGLVARSKVNTRPLFIMACENAVRASSLLEALVYGHLDETTRDFAKAYVSFPNTVVDRIVPNFHDEDPLAVRVEPFYEWIVERTRKLGKMPIIHGVQYVDSLDPYIERKLYTVNTGHCSAAYYGYLKGYQTIQQVMGDKMLRDKVRMVMYETGNLLIRRYQLNRQQHQKYISRILKRFSNTHLTDHVVRVGRCPLRKLSPEERLIRPALEAYQQGLDVPNLTSVIAAALLFDHAKDPEAPTLQDSIRTDGLEDTIANHLGIARKHPLHHGIAKKYEGLKYARAIRRGLPQSLAMPRILPAH